MEINDKKRVDLLIGCSQLPTFCYINLLKKTLFFKSMNNKRGTRRDQNEAFSGDISFWCDCLHTTYHVNRFKKIYS